MIPERRKGIAVLGSTGVIGSLTLEVIAAHADKFRLVSMAAGGNVDKALAQVREFQPDYVCMYDPAAARALEARLDGSEVSHGHDGLIETAVHPDVDMVVVAVSGAVGLMPTLAAIRSGKDIALANKETLVLGGSVVMPEVARHGVKLLPVDSEHSAVFQAARGERKRDLERIVLTASGGPFSRLTLEEMAGITPEQALRHPTWSMGPKITVDSATMMNKGLEIIEAMWLFDMPLDTIEVVVHPQSVVHSLAGFVDGSMLAQLGPADMRIPISYALGYPDRLNCCDQRFDLAGIGMLTFEQPDEKRFPALRLARASAKAGGTAPGVMNAANEVAVDLFLKGRIAFTAIAEVTETVLAAHTVLRTPSLEELLNADTWAREEALCAAGCRR
ncbi:MAG: 1-deoxy-D-xylulose-5-phosphate reductoisomerase [bacterium]|nr:1-deoxy-D-xylulose-5-phosphate reductoisomerase [bacterium]